MNLDTLVTAIRKLERKIPSINGTNDFWQGYKEAISDMWNEVDRLEGEEQK